MVSERKSLTTKLHAQTKLLVLVGKNSHWNCCVKKVLLKILQHAQKVICAQMLKAQVFSCEFCEISKNTFFTEHRRWLLLAQVFSCEYCEISKNNYFEERLQIAASGFTHLKPILAQCSISIYSVKTLENQTLGKLFF